MIPDYLVQLENELRGAAQGRRYDDVRRLSAAFCADVAAYAATLPPRDPLVAEAASKIDGLLSWAILMMQTARASCAEELRRASTAQRYLGSQGSPSGFRVEG